MKIWYQFSSTFEITRESDPNEQWDADDTSTTWIAPESVYISQPRQHSLMDTDVLPFDVEIADVVYCVWVQYSTGNSFGRDDGHYHEIIGWYRDPKFAEMAQAIITRGPPTRVDYEKQFVLIPSWDGSEERRQSCMGWSGYFESLDSCNVTPMLVELTC